VGFKTLRPDGLWKARSESSHLRRDWGGGPDAESVGASVFLVPDPRMTRRRLPVQRFGRDTAKCHVSQLPVSPLLFVTEIS
jgi:hypothetical protein